MNNRWADFKKKMTEKKLNELYILLGYANKSVKRNKIKKQIKHYKRNKKNNQKD